MNLPSRWCLAAASVIFTALAMEVEDLALLQRAGVQYRHAARARAPRLHLLSMGLSGSCLWGELLGPNAGRPYIFEPFNGGSSMWNHSSALLPNVRDGWNIAPSSYDFADLRTRLRCIYMCEGCKDAVKCNQLTPRCNSSTPLCKLHSCHYSIIQNTM